MAKKKTTKKKSAKKTAANKSTRSAGSAKKTSKKTAKKSAKKKAATKKNTSAKKAANKKAAKKKAASKKVSKKASTKTSTQGSKTAKLATSKDTNTKRDASPKPLVKKKKSPARPAVKAELTDEQKLHQDMEKQWTVEQLKRVKTGLTKKKLDAYLKVLLEKRAEIIGNVQGMETARNAALADIAHMPLHMADVGSDNFDQEFTLGLMESERRMLREIEEAILRMREGYYGVCLDSGRPIDEMRLEYVPWAKHCIAVARLHEKRGW